MGLFFLLPFLPVGRGSVFAAVVINEIFPKTEDVTLEWIELYNTGNESVSLNLWTLANTVGDAKTFHMGAEWNIFPHGFLTFYQSRTGISLNASGDTVRLSDDKNTLVDSQSYSSTIGMNRSMGRSTDGGGVWTTCNDPATPDNPNTCPSPTPTPTQPPTPTPTPVVTIAPTDTPIPTVAPPSPIPTSLFQAANREAQPQVLGVVNGPTPPTGGSTSSSADLITLKLSKTLVVQILIIGVVWAFLALIAILRRHFRRRVQRETEIR